MRYLSLFSGIEACTVAWQSLGWEAVAFAEFDDFPKAVLAHHYPDVPDLGDVTKITKETLEGLGKIDLVVGGSPCQNLSVAGNRKGLKGDESSLFFEFIRIFELARRYNGARYLLWENVPGAFSTHGGHDFKIVLELMAGGRFSIPEDGWKNSGVGLGRNGLIEWRELDAQYFGVPQRRRRIFALQDTGEWWGREPILFEPESCSGDIEAGEGQREGVAPGARESPEGYGVIYENHANDSRVTRSEGVSPALTSRMGTGGGNVHLVMEKSFTTCAHGQYAEGVGTLRCAGGDLGGGSENLIVGSYDMKQYHNPQPSETVSLSTNNCATIRGDTPLIEEQTSLCFLERAGKDGGGKGILMSEDKTFTLSTIDNMRVAHEEQARTVVRRLTPVECERLQGFPDNYTNIPWAGRDSSPDSRRYKALGNSMAVPVMRWIGERIQGAKPVVYDQYAISIAALPPLTAEEQEAGQGSLF